MVVDVSLLSDRATELGSASSSRCWRLLNVRGRWEKPVSRSLFSQGIVHCVPYELRSRVYGETAVKVDVPLFPGYVFVHGEKEVAEAAARLAGVIRVVASEEGLRVQRQISSLFFAVRSSVPMSPCLPVREARLVEVFAGPLRGLRGRYTDGTAELILEVEVLHRAVKMKMEPRLLRDANDVSLKRA